mmetsp:Transcript_25598/g.56448  ORF Transcript_25598/g.56448 Transcript_25598/m.56448 type:complete len:121 (-) Transcript_25598:97-459(-)
MAGCPYDGQTVPMYHDTTAARAQAILSDGFVPSPDGMLGKGVYLSPDISKARLHGSAILECRVNVGKVKRIDCQRHPMQKSWRASGFDSAWCPPNCGMVGRGLEENCIYDPSRVTVLRLQ